MASSSETLLEETLLYKDRTKNNWIEILVRVNKHNVMQLYTLEGTEKRLSKFDVLLAEFKFTTCTFHSPPVSPTYKKFSFELLFQGKSEGYLFAAKNETCLNKWLSVLKHQQTLSRSSEEDRNTPNQILELAETPKQGVETLIRRLKNRDQETDSFIAATCWVLSRETPFEVWSDQNIKVMCEVFLEFSAIQTPTQEEMFTWASAAKCLAGLCIIKDENQNFRFRETIFNFKTESHYLVNQLAKVIKGGYDLQYQQETVNLFKILLIDSEKSRSGSRIQPLAIPAKNLELLEQFVTALPDLVQKTLIEMSRDSNSEIGRFVLEIVCAVTVNLSPNPKFSEQIQDEKLIKGLVALIQVTLQQSRSFIHPFKALSNILRYYPQTGETMNKVGILSLLLQIKEHFEELPAFKSQCETFIQQLQVKSQDK